MRRHPAPSVSRCLLVVGALFAGALVGLAPRIVTQTEPSANDRGGPVVVGGLPCLVDPTLADMFWLPLGRPSGVTVEGMPAVLGIIGPPNLKDVLISAQGTPYGWIETNPDYRVLGLSNVGTAVLDRVASASGTVVLWQWVPEGYVGGRVTIHTALGSRRDGITGSAFPLPLLEVAIQPGTSVGTVEIAPNPDNPELDTLQVRLTANGFTVEVEYLP